MERQRPAMEQQRPHMALLALDTALRLRDMEPQLRRTQRRPGMEPQLRRTQRRRPGMERRLAGTRVSVTRLRAGRFL